MKPLNKKERNKAFFKVVGLFLISFIIALLVGFTTMNTGSLADKQSRSELQKIKDHLKFQEEIFAPNVNEATLLLEKLPNYKDEGENKEVLNQDIAALVSKTKNEIAEEESWETTMYKNVIQALSDLQLAYNEQISLREEIGDSDEATQRLQDCINERNQLQNQVNTLKAGGGGGADCAQCEKNLKDAQQKLRQCNLENKALKQEIERIRNR
jgi:hypothetical protein